MALQSIDNKRRAKVASMVLKSTVRQKTCILITFDVFYSSLLQDATSDEMMNKLSSVGYQELRILTKLCPVKVSSIQLKYRLN